MEPTHESRVAHMQTYEGNNINRSLEDSTTYTCFRAPPKAMQTP